jgi:hypothetical protein
MNPIIDHLQITVKDLTNVELSYGQLMQILGFDLGAILKGKVEAQALDVIEYTHPNVILTITSHHRVSKTNAGIKIEIVYKNGCIVDEVLCVNIYRRADVH